VVCEVRAQARECWGRPGISHDFGARGFTTQVYDRIPDPDAPKPRDAARRWRGVRAAATEPSKLVGPVAGNACPWASIFWGRPFAEPTLLRIAAAYENATKTSHGATGFGPL